MARKTDSEDTFKVSIRHLDSEGVLAFCFSTFYKFGWNVCELENVVFDKREACATNIVFKGVPNGSSPQVFNELLNNPAVLDVKF